jgi:hypothetical protein
LGFLSPDLIGYVVIEERPLVLQEIEENLYFVEPLSSNNGIFSLR